MKKLYLAGPDVFLPNAAAHGEALKKVCLAHGYEGLFPLDNQVPPAPPAEMAAAIRKANVELIRRADGVIANLSPFRGPEPDSGTVWETGFAQGLGKPVVAWSSDRRSLKERTVAMLGLPDGAERDREGLAIEDFGLSHNLMFAHLVVADSFEGCFPFFRW